MPRPTTLAVVARRRNTGEDFSVVLREFLDEFCGSVRRGEAPGCIVDEPEPVPDANAHAARGVIGEHRARRWNLPMPAWTDLSLIHI